jgi:methionine biosynthesis protein MetW
MENNIYRKKYNSQNNLGNLAENPRIKSMLETIDRLDLRNSNILDIGCYDGTFLSLIKNRDNNFIGVEASDWGAEKSKKTGIHVQQYFFDGNTKFPFEDSFFDVVIAGEIIEHVYDTDYFLFEIYRILKTGGKLLISTPNIASFGRRIFLLFGINPIIEISPNEPDSSGHIRYFTFKTLRNLLKKNKFKIISSRSDCINFTGNGKIKSVLLAKLFPKLGASIIYYAKKSS